MNSEPGLSFHDRARRVEESCSTDEQFLARCTACRWQTLLKFRQRDVWCQFQKDSLLTAPIASMQIQDSMCWHVHSSLPIEVLPSLHPTHSDSPSAESLLNIPGPVSISHHSLSSVLLGTLDSVRLDLVSRYYHSWLCLCLLFESHCILRAAAMSHCNLDQCLAHHWKCSQLFVAGWNEGIYV